MGVLQSKQSDGPPDMGSDPKAPGKPTEADGYKEPKKWDGKLVKEVDMVIPPLKGEIKEGAGFVKEEMNEHGKSPESQRKAQEGRDLRNERRRSRLHA